MKKSNKHTKTKREIVKTGAEIVCLPIVIGSLAGYVASIGTSSIIDHSGRAVAKPFKACKLASCADKVESIATEFTFLTTAGMIAGGGVVGSIGVALSLPAAVVTSFYSIVAGHSARKRARKQLHQQQLHQQQLLQQQQQQQQKHHYTHQSSHEFTAAKLLSEKRSDEHELADEVSTQIALPPTFAIILEQQQDPTAAATNTTTAASTTPEVQQPTEETNELQLSLLCYQQNGQVDYINNKHQFPPLLNLIKDGNKSVLAVNTSGLINEYFKLVVLVEVPETLECSSTIGVTPVTISTMEKVDDSSSETSNNNDDESHKLMECNEFKKAHNEATEFFKNANTDDAFIIKYSTSSMQHCRLYAMCRIECKKYVDGEKELFQWEYCPLRAAFKQELDITNEAMMIECASILKNMPLSQDLQLFDDYSATC